jgi:rare lipoprotein A
MRVTARPIHAGLLLTALALSGAASCGRHHTRVKVPVAPARIGTTETGVASWYGIPYHGRRAASGEIYDMGKLTAAHRQLPFETWIEVTNLANGKIVDVRINDRGPFVHGRILDVSQAAARELDMLRAGTARVRVRVISAPPPLVPAASPVAVPTSAPVSPSPAAPVPTAAREAIAVDLHAVQAGVFADRDHAEALRSTLEQSFADARILPGPRNLWRVVVGREMTLDQANELAARVRRETGDALVVREPGANPPANPPTTPGVE